MILQLGVFVASYGCIRLLNEDVADLCGRVHVGTRVIMEP
jgi:lipoprotein-anchoring transpeptidase ErfK/SrfK